MKYLALLFALLALDCSAQAPPQVVQWWGQYPQFDRIYGMSGWWKMDSGSGSSIADSYGSLTGSSTAAWTNTLYGIPALYFNGNAKITFSETSYGTVHTWCVWVRPGSQTGQYNFGCIIDGAGTGGGENCNPLEVSGTNADTIGYTIASSGVGVTVPSMLNEWHHIASTRNGVNVTLYLDGGAVFSGALPNNNPCTFRAIGVRTSASLYYRGSMADCRAYTRVLTSTEIAKIFLAGPK